MQLKSWIKANKVSQTWAAKELGMFNSDLSRILSGDKKITLMQVSEVYDMTNGAVTYWDWIEFYGKK